MKAFQLFAVAVSLAPLTQAFATGVAIDDSTNTLTVSINCVSITFAGQRAGNCAGGCQNVTGLLILPGSASTKSASLNFDGFTITAPKNVPFFSSVLVLPGGRRRSRRFTLVESNFGEGGLAYVSTALHRS